MEELKRKTILVVSDAHGRTDNLQKILAAKQYDAMICCGDSEGIEHSFPVMAGCPAELIQVRGNNDYNSGIPFMAVTPIGKSRAFVTHGHLYELYSGYDRLKNAAESRNCNICIFGHIHKPVLKEYNGILLLNPGSVSEPRQTGGVPTFAEIEISEQKIRFRILELNGSGTIGECSVSNN